MVEGSVESKVVKDDVGKEKVAVLGEFSFVEQIFGFFLFTGISRSCNVSAQMGGLILSCWDDETDSIEQKSGGFGDGEGVGGENGCGDACAGSLC